MGQKERLQQSIERLLLRDDVILTREQLNEYINTGKWTEASFVDYLEQHAMRNPNGIAIIDEDGTKVSYEELHRKTDQLAVSLLELGLRPEDRIAIQLPNCHQFVVTLMGAAKARIMPVLCHMPYTEQDLDYVFGLTEPRAIVIPDYYKNKNYLDMIRKLQEKHTCLEHIIVVSENQYEGTTDFNHFFQKETQSAVFQLEKFRPVGTDPFLILFTSGTTGRPKAILHLHANNLYYIDKLDQALGAQKNRNVLVTSPIAHLTGLGAGVLTSLYSGGTVTLLSMWDVKKAVDLIEREKLSYMLGIAPMLIDLARYGGKRDLGSLKHILYAGAPCPSEILNTLNNEIGCSITAFYGYSEGGLVHSTRPGDDISITSTSFGKVVDGIEAKIVDELGKELQGPCEGEVLARGANFIPGYYRQPENNKKMFDEDGWFHSADIVRMDEKGYCTFLSRRDDLINRGGYKIDPRELEEALFHHPLINQAVVVAMPDERLGERIAAFIILKDSTQSITLEEIMYFLLDRGVSKKIWPEAIKIVEHFPRNNAGKIQRFVLREQAKDLKISS